jgi:hypothetical protein
MPQKRKSGGAKTFRIDTNVPYLYLTQAKCDSIAKAFNLTYDAQSDRYLISDQVHSILQDSAAGLHFELQAQQVQDGKFTSTIIIGRTLSYHSLNLYDGWPFGTGGRYFPMRVASRYNFVLGRAFLQDHYMVANYENQTFNLHEIDWTAPPTEKQIVMTPPTSREVLKGPHKSAKPLSPVAIAGIVTGAIFFLLILLLIFICRRAKVRISVKTGNKEELTTKNSHMTDIMDRSGSEDDEPTPVEAPVNIISEADSKSLPPPVELGSLQIQEMPNDTDAYRGHFKPAELQSPAPVFEMEGSPTSALESSAATGAKSGTSSKCSTPSQLSTHPSSNAISITPESTTFSSEGKDTIAPLPVVPRIVIPVETKSSSAVRDRLRGIEVPPPSPIPQTPLEYYGGVVPESRWKQAQKRAVQKGIERERARREERMITAMNGSASGDNSGVRVEERPNVVVHVRDIEDSSEDEERDGELLPAYDDINRSKRQPKSGYADEKAEAKKKNQKKEKDQNKQKSSAQQPSLGLQIPNLTISSEQTPASPIPRTPLRFYQPVSGVMQENLDNKVKQKKPNNEE